MNQPKLSRTLYVIIFGALIVAIILAIPKKNEQAGIDKKQYLVERKSTPNKSNNSSKPRGQESIQAPSSLTENPTLLTSSSVPEHNVDLDLFSALEVFEEAIDQNTQSLSDEDRDHLALLMHNLQSHAEQESAAPR